MYLFIDRCYLGEPGPVIVYADKWNGTIIIIVISYTWASANMGPNVCSEKGLYCQHSTALTWKHMW